MFNIVENDTYFLFEKKKCNKFKNKYKYIYLEDNIIPICNPTLSCEIWC